MTARIVALLAAMLSWQGPAFHAETRLVVLHATVRNDRGELVTGLDRHAFTVSENGRRQPIAIFRNDDVPVSIGLLIDNSGSMRTKRSKVEAAALAFARASNPDDQLFVVNFADKPRLDVPFTSDLLMLESHIARVDSIGGTAMRDAIDLALRYMKEHAQRDRRVLLVITDGNDNASTTPLDQIRSAAEQGDVAVYAIGLLNDVDEGKAKQAEKALERIAETTGGFASFPRSLEQIGDTAVGFAKQIRTQYTIGYTPQNQALDGSYRRVDVGVKGQTRLTVRTRSGYRATPDLVRPAPDS